MKKIAATLLLAFTLTFGGLAAPAQAADEPAPTWTCEDWREYWTDTALEGQAVIETYHEKLMQSRADLVLAGATANDYRTVIAQQADTVAELQEANTRLQRKADRRKATIQRLRAKIRDLRRR